MPAHDAEREAIRRTEPARPGGTAIARGARWVASAFEPSGRLGGHAYRRFMLRAMLAAACVVCIAIPVGGIGARAPALALAALLPILALCAAAQTIRRLHDRGRTGWWLAPNIAVWLAGFAPIEAWVDQYPLSVLVFVLTTDGFTLWWLLEAFGLPGTPGTNRYGAALGPD